MTRHRKPADQLDRIRRRISRLDGASIDELYGLEPVWEPGAGTPCLTPEEFVAVRCPYCGERLETRVDLTADEPSYIEDCEVCCRPIEYAIERDPAGMLLALQARRLD
jgi:cysteine-rich CPXCG protein